MTQAKFLLCLPPFVLLAACAAPQGDYPSLAIRDAERVSGTMEVAPPPPPPAPPPAATLESIEQLLADARAAHTQFQAATPAARSVTQGASGSARGSDSWSRAQVAIADLEARRSIVMIALADLDRLYVNAATSAEDLTLIAVARDEIGVMVDEQNSVIDSLLGVVR